jgi:GxxExxY protein
MDDSKITEMIIGAAIEVHRHLGPGLLESTYETCLVHELSGSGLSLARQKTLPVRYKGLSLEDSYRPDLIIAEQVITEIKAVSTLLPVHTAQLLTYLRLTGLKVGLLINFNVSVLKNGIKRVRND